MPYDSGQEVYTSSYRQNPRAYRTGLTAADTVPAPTIGSTSAVAGGSCVADTYNVKVVAGNDLGRTPFASGVQVTATTNLTVRIPISGSTPNAAYYDIYCSTDADPKWVGRVTAAQLAAGAVITAVGTVGAGSVAGSVDVRVPGTGNVLGSGAVENTAYILGQIPIFNAGNSTYVELDVTLSVVGDSGADAVVLIPFMTNSNVPGAFYQFTPQVIAFGGAAGQYGTYRQKVRIDVRAAQSMVIAVAKITGDGASVDIQYTLCS